MWSSAVRSTFSRLVGTRAPRDPTIDAVGVGGSVDGAVPLAPIHDPHYPPFIGPLPSQQEPKEAKSIIGWTIKQVTQRLQYASEIGQQFAGTLDGGFPPTQFDPHICDRSDPSHPISASSSLQDEKVGSRCSNREPIRGFAGPSFKTERLKDVVEVVQEPKITMESCHFRCGYPTWTRDTELRLQRCHGMDLWVTCERHPGKCYHDYRVVSQTPQRVNVSRFPTHSEVFCPTDDPLDRLSPPKNVVAEVDSELAAHLSVAACFRERTVALAQMLASKGKRYCDKLSPSPSWAWRQQQIPLAVARAMEPCASERAAWAHMMSEPVLFNILQANKPFREQGSSYKLSDFTARQFLSMDLPKQVTVVKNTACESLSKIAGFSTTLPKN